ncbi:hypothetical protein ABDK00_009845 [Niabella insulamsoli]|uniref:hypothetical protein n=1 Tax=Niabella insulamsoli TaxID=3144874 RepID=UPI0031FC6895
MTQSYHIENEQITATFTSGVVRLRANAALQRLMRNNIKGLSSLASFILRDYEQYNQKRLAIKPDSLIVEIAGHVYAYQLLRWLRRKWPAAFLKMLSLRACTIDCGDRVKDSNRWFWDFFRFIKPLLFVVNRSKNDEDAIRGS